MINRNIVFQRANYINGISPQDLTTDELDKICTIRNFEAANIMKDIEILRFFRGEEGSREEHTLYICGRNTGVFRDNFYNLYFSINCCKSAFLTCKFV